MCGRMCGMPVLNVRKRTDFRLSLEAIRLIVALAKKKGVGRTHILELAVRDMAKVEGVK
jgi:hypothetical protein